MAISKSMETTLVIVATLWMIGWAEIMFDPNEKNPFDTYEYNSYEVLMTE